MQIIPIASGKGGVGKSLLSANLAVALGQAGKKVILADGSAIPLPRGQYDALNRAIIART